jgi:deoxyribonuclease-4
MGLLGCHVTGGIDNAPQNGHALGCEAIQVFTRGPSQWKCKPLSEERITNFRSGIKAFNLQAVMTHSIYLINLASADRIIRRKSEAAFLEEMDRCEALGIPYLVFHPGSYRNSTERLGIRRLTNSLQRLLNKRPNQKVQILIENTAGAGFLLGDNFEQIGLILDQIEFPKRVHVCFDTSHAYAAGYDLQTKDDYHEVMAEFDSNIGLKRLKGFHLNDSKTELSSRRDRHENLGHGFIGEVVFEEIVNDARFKMHPMVLETPGGEDWFRKNLQLLFRLRKQPRTK